MALEGVSHTAPTPTGRGGPPPNCYTVLEQVTKLPATYSTSCLSNDLDTSSPASLTTQDTATRLLPTTTPAFNPEPSTFSTVAVHEDTFDTDDMEAMSLTASAPTESRTSQSLRLFVDCGLHTPLPTKCSIKRLDHLSSCPSCSTSLASLTRLRRTSQLSTRVNTNSCGLGNEERPAWPPPELQILHAPGIQHLQPSSPY